MNEMQAVTATAQAAAGMSASRAATGFETLDYDAFLHLLVTQMQNQDPLEPTSQTEYIAQLAQFSNVEQNTKTNQRLDALLTATSLNFAEGLIGRTIGTPDGRIGVVASVRVTDVGTVAMLSDGTLVPVGAGTTIG